MAGGLKMAENAAKTRALYRKHVRIGEEILYLTEQDVNDIGMTTDEIYKATEQSMIDYSRKLTEMPAKIGLHPMPDSLMHAMPAYLPNQAACGIKWGANFPTNKRLYPDVTPTNGQMILNDVLTGQPLAIMDGNFITKKRTPATALVSIKASKKLDVSTFGMIGSGIQGKETVEVIEYMLKKLDKIYIYDMFEESMDALIARCQPKVNAKIVKAKSFEEVIKSCETIVSAIPIAHTPNPPVKNEWVSAGQTLVCQDCHTVYEDSVYKRADKYYVDSIEQHELLSGYGYYPHGLPAITGETGAAAAGDVPTRTSDDELVIFNNVGMAVEDIMCAKTIFERALEKGIGVKLPLLSSSKNIFVK